MRITAPLSTLCLLLTSACSRTESPFPPAQALQTLRIDPSFRLELFAAEPMFADPVAMEIDEDGRLYVVQNSGYPLNVQPGSGKVWLLEDSNGDGRPDRSTLFAGDLVLPTGILRWKKGVLVTDAPNVWYLEDTDGDGKADIKRSVLSGFAFTNPQHTVNTPLYGLDNWIYLAHEGFANAVVYADKFGDHGSDIHYTGQAGSPTVRNERRNVRFRPGRQQLETTSSTSQFGLSFDDYGHLLTVNNSSHAREEVLAARYLARNPDLPAGSAMQDVSDHGAAAPVFAILEKPRFELLSGTGFFTSACSITWWQGGTLVAEPVHSLVHRDLWQPLGATFRARRAREGVEFLASTDNWFRPVNFYVGPDDALYVLDYYRKMIEHPEWTSKEVQESKEIYDGRDLGRIYRVLPAGVKATGTTGLRLSAASTADLVRYLERPNVWWRRTAQRLLVDRNSPDAVAPLRRLAESSPSPLGRLHALWTLDGMNQLDAALVQKALLDPEPGVRENALILSESRLDDPALAAALPALEHDPHPRVRFQLLATLGSVRTRIAAQVRARLLLRDGEDPWVQMAALSAGSGEALPALQSALAAPGSPTPGRTGYFRQLGSLIGSRAKPAEVSAVIRQSAARPGTPNAWWRAALLDGVASGLRSRQASLPAQPLLLTLYKDPDPGVRRGALRLLEISGLPPGADPRSAAEAAADSRRPGPLRADALTLLALASPARGAIFYGKFIHPGEPEEVQLAALHALGKEKGPAPAPILLSRWRSMTPAVRAEAASVLTGDPARFPLLLAAMESGDVQPWSLPGRLRVQMQMNRDPALRERARKLFASHSSSREAEVARYQAALAKRAGDRAAGHATFTRICANCHSMEGEGAAVGPDLATVRNRTPDLLLRDILLPSSSIAQMYESYVVETVSNGTLEGVLGEQTAAALTLVQERGKKEIIPRSQVRQMYVSNLSAMPEDLDKEISPEQMADLIAYLRSPK